MASCFQRTYIKVFENKVLKEILGPNNMQKEQRAAKTSGEERYAAVANRRVDKTGRATNM
jgi:hypothetical protein